MSANNFKYYLEEILTPTEKQTNDKECPGCKNNKPSEPPGVLMPHMELNVVVCAKCGHCESN